MEDAFASAHADLRLMQRTGDLDISMSELWDGAIPCDIKGHGYDEARVSPSHDVVMLMVEGRVVALLDKTHDVSIDYTDLQGYLDNATENFK